MTAHLLMELPTKTVTTRSTVEDVDLDDLAVSHREDGPRCVWQQSRRATALSIAASHVESAQLLSA